MIPFYAPPLRAATSTRLLALIGVLAYGVGLGNVIAQTTSPRIPVATLPVLRSTTAGSFGAYTTNGNDATLVQNSPAGIINWSSFDIGAAAKLQIIQPSNTSTLLNRIEGGLLGHGRTTIDGSLTSNGQIYLINPSGIVFGSTARVDVGSLIASSLAIDDSRYLSGLLSPGIAPNLALDPANRLRAGDIVVEGSRTGGVLQQAALSAAKNGFILLAAPSVINDGKLNAPDGQVVLAAGTRVYLAAPENTAMRGLRVEVGDDELKTLAAGQAPVTTTNGALGDIRVDRGNVTMAGLLVNQLGKVSATTSVNQNGSVWLLARTASRVDPEKGAQPVSGGTLVLGTGSETEALPDLQDKATSTVSATFNPSSVLLSGRQIALQANATIRAPGGKITIEARAVPGSNAPGAPNNSGVEFATGSRIEAAGSTVVLPMESHVVEAELRGTELADNPLLRDSALRGSKVLVDARKGTAVANISGWLGLRESGVGEKTSKGGTVDVFAEGSIVQAAGSQIDVSGGSVTYASGNVATTRLRAGEAVFDIGSAPANLPYDGLIAAKAGASNFEASYTDGRDAGSLRFSASQLTLGGNLTGSVTIGARQRLLGSPNRPLGAELQIGSTPAGAISSGISQNLLLGSSASMGGITPQETQRGAETLRLDLSALGRAGFSRITLDTRGDATIGGPITMPVGSALSIRALGLDAEGSDSGAGSIRVEAPVNMPSGSFSATARRLLTMANDINVDMAGGWVNDQIVTNALRDKDGFLAGEIGIRGGSITLAGNRVLIGDRVTMNVSAGAWQDASGQLTKGEAGSIALRATRPPVAGLEPQLENALTLGRGLDLKGYGWSRGASISLTGRNVYIGGFPEDTRPGIDDLALAPAFFERGGFSSWSIAANGNLAVAPGTQIAPAAENWVASPALSQTPSGSMEKVASARLIPLASALGIRPMASVSLSATSTPEGSLLDPGPARFGVVSVGNGAAIAVDPGAAITLRAARAISVDGTLDAPGGAITLALTQTAPSTLDFNYDPQRSIRLGPQAQLLAIGSTARLLTDAGGTTTGTLLDGGTIRIGRQGPDGLLSAVGYVVASAGSLLDVSGVNAGVRRFSMNGQLTPDRVIASGAGTIEIRAREGFSIASTLRGIPGSPNSSGGSLFLALDRDSSPGGSGYPTIQSDFRVLASPLGGTDSPAAGESLDRLAGQGLIAHGSFAAGGFDRLIFRSDRTLSLAPGLRLSGGTSIVLDTPVLRPIGSATAASTLVTAPFVQLGNGDDSTQEVSPPPAAPPLATTSTESGRALTVEATTIDVVGRSRIDGYTSTRLSASEEIRLTGRLTRTPSAFDNAPDALAVVGGLTTAGDLNLNAPQTYPTSLTDFELKVGSSSDSHATLTVEATSNPGTPLTALSAGGRLRASAWSIDQRGRLSAPFGTLELLADGELHLREGSVTSVAGQGQVLLGDVSNGKDWLYEFRSANSNQSTIPTLRFTGMPSVTGDTYERRLPVKSMQLRAPRISIDRGATVDLSGTGQVWSSEFVPGPLGSSDPLLRSGTYAIMPNFRASVASADWTSGTANANSTGLQPNGNLRVGDAVWLSGMGELAAGYYTLLPARYALLPGAYAITQSTSQRNFSSSSNRVNLDGSMTMAGYRASMIRSDGTRAADAQWSGFSLAPNPTVRRSGEFRLYDASTLFSAQAQAYALETTANYAPELPGDAGHLTLAVESALTLAGRFNMSGAESGVIETQARSIGANATLAPTIGRGGLVDISAPNLRIGIPSADPVMDRDTTSTTVVLDADQITAMRAASVAIGGIRTTQGSSMLLDVRTQKVTVANDRHHPLEAPELIIASRDVLQVDGPAVLAAHSSSARPPRVLSVVGSGIDVDGALLRLNSATNVERTLRTGPAGQRGSLDISPGAVLDAPGSLTIEATRDLKLRTDLGLPDRSNFSLAAPRISLGTAVPADVDDVVFSGASLNQLGRLASIDLQSYSTIDFYGAFQLGSPQLTKLSLNAAGLVRRDPAVAGFAPSQVTLTAGKIRLSGRGAALSSDLGALEPVQSPSSFVLSARDAIELAEGALTIRGFTSADLIAGAGGFRATGADMRLSGGGDLNISAGKFSAGPGAGATVSAAGNLWLGNSVSIGQSAAVGDPSSRMDTLTFGGDLRFVAARELHSNADISLPSGRLSLTGGTGLEVSGGRLSVAGGTTVFGSTAVGAPGGTIALTTTTGNLSIGRGSSLNVGAIGADGGQLVLAAPQGQVSLDGALNGVAVAGATSAPVSGSRVAIDAGTVEGVESLGRLARRFGDAGFSDGFSLRVRSGSLRLAQDEAVRAREVQVAVDNGNLRIDGVIDASGSRAGEIGLYASERDLAPGNAQSLPSNQNLGRIEVGSSARLLTSAGGRVVLGVSREDGATPTSINGGSSILIEKGASIVATGDSEGLGARLLLRAPRVGTSAAAASDVAISMQGVSLSGITETEIEANQVYTLNDGVTLTANPDSANNLDVGMGGKMQREAQSFVQSRAAILSRLGTAERIVLRPGIEVRSKGSLTVSVNEDALSPADRGWDLSAWRMAGQPGTLTLRAATTLDIIGAMSDGYVRPPTALAMPAWQLDPAAGASWSYRLVAGSDLGAAHPMAVVAPPQATTPTAATTSNAADLRLRFARDISVDEDGEPLALADLPVSLVRSGTGRIDLAAARDVVLSSLVRTSPTDPTSDVRLGATVYTGGRAIPPAPGWLTPTYLSSPAWGNPTEINAPFGRDGGPISIIAGRDVLGSAQPWLITNALVRRAGAGIDTAWWMRTDQLFDGVATLGGGDLRVVASGEVRDLSATIATSARTTRAPSGIPSLNEFGGGRLQVSASQDIAGGMFYVQKGEGEIRAGRSLTFGSPSIWDVFVGENGAYRAHSPILALGTGQFDVLAGNKLRLESVFNPTITRDTSSGAGRDSAFLTYGANSSLRLRALAGDLTLTNDDQLLVQASSGLSANADPGIDPDYWFRFTPGRITAAALGGDLTVLNSFSMAPVAAMQLDLLAKRSVNLRNGAAGQVGIVQLDVSPAQLPGATTPRSLERADYELLRGRVEGLLGHNSLNLQAGGAEPMRIIALEGDITGDNRAAASLTLTRRAEILAGRDIRDLGFRIQQVNTDNVTQIRAGRDLIDSTISTGLGNPVTHVITGPGRVEVSAGRHVDFGNGGGLVTRGNLDNPYLAEQGASIQVAAGVAGASTGSGALDGSDPAALLARLRLGGFNASDLAELRPQLNEAFYNRLVEAAKVSGLSDFDALIAALFPITSAVGNIDLTGSQVKTEQGGSIDLFAPSGSINVALLRVPSFISNKKSSELGVFTVRGGAIRALVRDDFLVNSGRVFSLRGGDISLVSQYGSIDAGRGAKTAASAPPPLLTTDKNGNTKLDLSGSVAGSGIATLQTQPDQAPSNVYPVAPRGIFDAGDAGVRSTGTVQITAQTVLNAGNISAAGGVSGAPVVAAPSLGAVAIPASTAASGEGVSKSASTEQRLLSLDVEVLCFGEGEQAVEAGSAKGAANESCKRQTKSPAPVSELSPIINSQSQL